MAYNEADENKKKECITLLKEKAKSKGGKLSYGEISEIIGNLDMDKDFIDDVYEKIMNMGIEIESEMEIRNDDTDIEPDEAELLNLDVDDLEHAGNCGTCGKDQEILREYHWLPRTR